MSEQTGQVVDEPIEQPTGYDAFVEMANEGGEEPTKLLNPNDFLEEDEDTPEIDEDAPDEEEEAEEEETPEDKPEAKEKEPEPAKEAKPEEKKEEKKDKPAKEAKEPTVLELVDAAGKPVQVKDDVKLKAKVDGEEKEFTLAEAIRHYQFDVPYQRKMQEVNEQRNKLEKDISTKEQTIVAKEEEVKTLEQQVKSQAQELGSHLVAEMKDLQAKDVPGFISKFSEARKVSAAAVHSVLREHFLKEAADYIQADEVGKKNLDLEAKARYLEEESKQTKTKQQLAESYNHNQKIAASVLQQAQVSQQEWAQAESQVIKDLVSKGIFQGPPKPEDVARWTPHQASEYAQTVVTLASANRQNNRIASLINQAAPTLREQDPNKYNQIVDFSKRFWDWDDNKLLAVIASQTGGSRTVVDDEDVAVPKAGSTQQPAKSSETSNSSARGMEDDDEEDDNPLNVFAGIGSF
jgi:hypothetical protein